MPAALTATVSMIAVFMIALAAQTPGGQRAAGPSGPPMTMTIAAFSDGGQIPVKYSQAAPGAAPGEGTSPAITWTNVPAGTQSFVLNMRDMDVARNKTTEDQAHSQRIAAAGRQLPGQRDRTGLSWTRCACHRPHAPLHVRAVCPRYETRCAACCGRVRNASERDEGHARPRARQGGLRRPVQAAAIG
jgi:phosphatidylethanolamine-binding protein